MTVCWNERRGLGGWGGGIPGGGGGLRRGEAAPYIGLLVGCFMGVRKEIYKGTCTYWDSLAFVKRFHRSKATGFLRTHLLGVQNWEVLVMGFGLYRFSF